MTNKIDKIQMPDGQVLELNDGGSTWGLITGNIVAQTDLQTALNNKQDKGNYALKSEIPTNNNQLTNGAGYITSSYHDSTKQNVITDLATIRSGASKGATALQSYTETDPVYTADKPNIANINLNNLSEAGLKVIKDNSGGGLEVGDISMALYVDETKGLRRYLNGQIVDINTNTQAFLERLKQITTLHPSLLCTEEEWQTAKTMSAFGQVGKFVFNYSGDEIVSVRLPRVVNVQGLFDLQNLGMTVGAGLPNITGLIDGVGRDTGTTASGAFYTRNSTSGACSSTGYAYYGLTFDASRSNSIYGNSTTVQPEAIQYPYFIQIATGSETEANIVNTLENVNGFTLLESKYSDKPLYNESWLLSNGQYNAKSVYPTAYEGLQVEYNTGIEAGTTVTLPSGVSYTKRGLSVKLSTETYTDYDFVLNTANETFRLPLKTKQKFYNDTAPVVGNGLALGLTNGTANAGLTNLDANTLCGSINSFGATVGATQIQANPFTSSRLPIGVVTDTTKSGLETHLTETTLYLYFYVGDIDQNHGIVDMGRIGEQLANKQDKCIHIIDTYVNGTSGYNIWSNGYCEQWGVSPSGEDKATVTVTLLNAFKDTNYNVISVQRDGPSGNYTNGIRVVNYGTGSFQLNYRTGGTTTAYWLACGYIS